MPPEPPDPPRYDWSAGDQLISALKNFHDQLSGYINNRATYYRQNLGAPNSDNWCGGKRNDFEQQYGGQQSALSALLDQILTVQSAISHANDQAHQAMKGRR